MKDQVATILGLKVVKKILVTTMLIFVKEIFMLRMRYVLVQHTTD